MGIAKIAIGVDSTAGGTQLDDVTLPLAAATRTLPVNSLNIDRGDETASLQAEINGDRAVSEDLPFKKNPSVVAAGFLYQPVGKILAHQILGKTTTTGSGATGYSHAAEAVANTVFSLPATMIHCQREDQASPQVLVGAMLDELELSFPPDGPATWSATWRGLALVEASATALPAVDLAYLGSPKWALFGRDGQVFENGSGTKSVGITNYSIKFGPMFEEADYDWGANVEDVTLDAAESRLWLPAARKLKGTREITGSVTFRGLDMTRDLRASLARKPQLKVEFGGREIAGTSPAVNEAFTVDVKAAQYTGGGAAEITRDAKIDSTYQWKAVKPASGGDIAITTLDGTAGPVTAAG